jgi:hypothetical protein
MGHLAMASGDDDSMEQSLFGAADLEQSLFGDDADETVLLPPQANEQVDVATPGLRWKWHWTHHLHRVHQLHQLLRGRSWGEAWCTRLPPQKLVKSVKPVKLIWGLLHTTSASSSAMSGGEEETSDDSSDSSVSGMRPPGPNDYVCSAGERAAKKAAAEAPAEVWSAETGGTDGVVV